MSKEQLKMVIKELQEFTRRIDNKALKRIRKMIKLKDNAAPRIRKAIKINFQEQAPSTIKMMSEVVRDYVASKWEKESRQTQQLGSNPKAKQKHQQHSEHTKTNSEEDQKYH